MIIAIAGLATAETPVVSSYYSIGYSDYCEIISFVNTQGLENTNGSKCVVVNGYSIKVYPWEGIIIKLLPFSYDAEVAVVDNGFDGIDVDDEIDRIAGIDNLKDFLDSFPWKGTEYDYAETEEEVEIDPLEVLIETLK